MANWKAKQPKARLPWCHECGRKLYAGGRSYARAIAPSGHLVYLHGACTDGYEVVPSEKEAK